MNKEYLSTLYSQAPIFWKDLACIFKYCITLYGKSALFNCTTAQLIFELYSWNLNKNFIALELTAEQTYSL